MPGKKRAPSAATAPPDFATRHPLRDGKLPPRRSIFAQPVEEKLDIGTPHPSFYHNTDQMMTDDFIREFSEVAQYLNAEQKAKALERARYEGRIGRFLAEINASENKPTLKRFAPVWWSLPEFLEKEWYAKGWIRPDVDRQMVEAYDTGLPGLITKWEDTNGLLPGHLRFAKVLNRSSKAERASKKPDITKS